MKGNLTRLTKGRRRGMILAVSLFMVSLAAIASLLMVRTMFDHQRMNTRKRELTRAYNIAEAGISLVQHWGNDDPDHDFFPSDDYTPDLDLFNYDPPADEDNNGNGILDPGEDDNGNGVLDQDIEITENSGVLFIDGSVQKQFPFLYAQLANGKIVLDESALDALNCTASGNPYAGKAINAFKAVGPDANLLPDEIEGGKIKEIVIGLPNQYPFSSDDPPFPTDWSGKAIQIVIKSTGISALGVERTLISFCDISPFIKIKLPAALTSLGAGAVYGNAQVHWGESWSKDDFAMFNKSQVPYLDRTNANWDKWAKYRTEGKLTYPNNWQWDTNGAPWNQADRLYGDTNSDGISNMDHTQASGTAANPSNQDRDGIAPGGDLNGNGVFDPRIDLDGDGVIDPPDGDPLTPDDYAGDIPNPDNPFGGMRPGLLPDIGTNDYNGLDADNGNYRDAFYEDVPDNRLPWPDFAQAYEQFKDFAQQHGRFYTTNASGEILKDGVVVDFGDEFGSPNRDDLAYDFVFIDTIDGNPPASDGSNLATIDIQGSNSAAGIKGIFYICANVSANGTGNPPALSGDEDIDNDGVLDAGEDLDGDGVLDEGAEDPDFNSVTLDKIFLDGVLYAAGTLEMGGNSGVYGSAVAERGFIGGGTPNIWYNWRLRNGLDMSQGNLGSRFRRLLTVNYSVQLG